MKKKLVTLVTVVVATLGMVGMAVAGENSTYIWLNPSNVDPEKEYVSEDSRWGKDDSWYVEEDYEIIINDHDYAFRAGTGFSDGAFGNKDYMKRVGWTSKGYEVKGRLVNATYDAVETPWVQSTRYSGKYSVKNTGTDVDWKFTVREEKN